MAYQEKYLKYKKKYITLKNTIGGVGEILPTLPSKIIPFIESQLKTLFNIYIKLANYADMERNFNLISRNIILPNSISYNNTNKSIIYNNIIYNFNETTTIKCGTYNCIDNYRVNSEKIVFRYIKPTKISQPSILFKSFYENLKHFILYIIVKHWFNNSKIIPTPIGMFFYKNKTGYSFGMLMEGGKQSFYDYIYGQYTLTAPTLRYLEGVCAQIYETLYILNSKPDILQFKHNDLTPDNIVFTNTIVQSTAIPLIIDFGMSTFIIAGINFICPEYYANDSINLHNPPYANAIYDFLTLLYIIYMLFKINFAIR